MAESVLPLIHDPITAAGREALNIPPLAGVRSCLSACGPATMPVA